ncbi:MAG: hypothetical protein HZA50_17235 [Planctomycetes bacterium]|nr:hypothetical protein [Planctomycetota bacterium]
MIRASLAAAKRRRRGVTLMIAVLLVACTGVWLVVMTAGWQNIRMESDMICAKDAARNLQASGLAWAALHADELRNAAGRTPKTIAPAGLAAAQGNIEISCQKDDAGRFFALVKISARSGKSVINLAEKYPLE